MENLNILYIHSHDSGRYIQPYGYQVPTPNLQLLADQGVLFRRAFCAAPTCSPSRAALLTGQSAHSSGMIGLAHRGFSLKDYSQHIVNTLRKVDYTSALIGLQHVAGDTSVIGYDQIVPCPSRLACDVAPRAADYLTNHPAEPFFLDVGFFETHREFPEPGTEEDPDHCLPPPTLPDTPEVRYDMACYKASARQLDEGVGKVLQALDAAGLADRTLVISTTDHGIAFPGMKCNLTDHGIGVSLILRGPGVLGGGRVVDAMVSHIDMFPTLCELVNAPLPPWLQGTSLMPVLRGEAAEVNEEVFAEVSYHAAYEPQRAVRTQRYKYIRRFGERLLPVLPNCDDCPGKTIWMEHGWKTRQVDQEQLYDLIFDPNETHNQVGNPAYQDVLKEMRERLLRWMTNTDDPLLAGDVIAPKGAQVNDVNGVSPREDVIIV